MGGHDAGLIPCTVKQEGDTHWYLIKRVQTGMSTPGMGGVEWPEYTDVIIDPTAKQFKTPVAYSLGRGRGFLTKEPSRRAQALMDILLWQD